MLQLHNIGVTNNVPQLHTKPCTNQGIIDMNRNGNSATFFSYVCNGKKIKKLFASTLDRIPISVRRVSSMIVVLNDKVVLLLAAHAKKIRWEPKKPDYIAVFC